MAFGNRPVASLRKRAVYKTEFDIFKQNSDIELLSLVSYDEHDSCHLEANSLASKVDRREPADFSAHRKNFELINRNNARIAYNPNSKHGRTTVRQEREFKPNIWNKGDTTIYKAFARTSKSFLRNRTYGKKIERSRSCYSANEVRKPSNETLNKARCQSTCGYRTNERNWIKGAKTNKADVSNIGTKENSVNRNINKQSVSTNKTLWRTKSAPSSSLNKSYQQSSRTQDRPGYLTRGKSGKLLTRSERSQSELKASVEKDLTDEYTELNTQRTRDQEASRDQNISYIQEGRQDTGIDKASDITVSEECSSDNQFQKGRNKETEDNSDKKSGNFDVKSEDCFIQKSTVILDVENNQNSTDLVNGTDDPPESKDSGFASNTVTPELESGTITAECGEQIDQPRKHVQFACEGTEDSENGSLIDGCSVVSENGLSDRIGVSSNDSAEEANDSTTYDVNTLINDLERFGANSRLSVISAGCHSNYSHDDSLCGENASKIIRETHRSEEETECEETEGSQQLNSAVSDLESLNMSKEARYAILETLQDMGVKPEKRNKDIDFRDIRHKSVNVQRKQKDNRNRYEYYMQERTRSFYRQQFRSMDSVGNDENSSRYSSPTNAKECDDSTSDELHKGKLFPTIKEMNKPNLGVKESSQSKQIVTLENVRHRKHKIPGIGNYHMIASPDSDFEITPAGFDSRYNRPIISNEEMEIPPRFIRERSIQKCKNWLKRNISLSPLSLQPVKKS